VDVSLPVPQFEGPLCGAEIARPTGAGRSKADLEPAGESLSHAVTQAADLNMLCAMTEWDWLRAN